MEWLIYLQNKWNIDLVIVAIVFLSGLCQERFLSEFKMFKNPRTDAAWKTLLISFMVGIIYASFVYWDKSRTEPVPFKMYFISYFFATSIYDLVFRHIVRWIQKKIGADQDDDPRRVKPEDKPNL